MKATIQGQKLGLKNCLVVFLEASLLSSILAGHTQTAFFFSIRHVSHRLRCLKTCLPVDGAVCGGSRVNMVQALEEVRHGETVVRLYSLTLCPVHSLFFMLGVEI